MWNTHIWTKTIIQNLMSTHNPLLNKGENQKHKNSISITQVNGYQNTLKITKMILSIILFVFPCLWELLHLTKTSVNDKEMTI